MWFGGDVLVDFIVVEDDDGASGDAGKSPVVVARALAEAVPLTVDA